MELFRTMTGVELVHVPYKGSAPMVTDLLGGHVQVAFDNTPNVLPQVKAGKLRALAITSATRSAMVPDVPTVSEAGVPGYEVGVWFGIVAPAGTPPAILAKLNAELNRMLTMPDVKQKFADQGVEPVGGPPGRFAEHLKVQIEKWTKVVKDSGVKVE
jgi:tripartite-type tricarboxylate transporter receptor subunit TctC